MPMNWCLGRSISTCQLDNLSACLDYVAHIVMALLDICCVSRHNNSAVGVSSKL